jgi:4-hydroxybenzoate polyprenyltransferase/phosphoserine phosphatase
MNAPIKAHEILVVDLDGTLVRSDMLYETFWSAFSRSWTAPLAAMAALASGKAALKRRMAELAELDAAALPYNATVLHYVQGWRAKGGRTALVTASDQALAQCVAEHLGLFDEVHGSDTGTNLRGETKADFLAGKFGEGGFAYIGNHAADLPVWRRAGKAVVVDAPTRVVEKVNKMSRDAEHLPPSARSPGAYIRAMRPHQWLKNLLVFLPMLAAHDLTAGTFGRSVLAFVAFSLVASGVYVLNDLLDLSADRAHPRKRDRPIASGAVPVVHGTLMAPALLLAGLALSLPAGPPFVLVLLAYMGLTTAYSLYFKRLIVVDICLLAGLYTIRIVAGGTATGIPLSVWILAFSTFFFFSLAAVKRQAELVDGVAAGRVTARGRGYRAEDLSLVANMAIASGYVSVLVMALYLNSPDVLELYSRPQALWGICPVLLFWITRMVMVTHRGEMEDDPVVYAVHDRVSLLCFALTLGFAAAGALL